MLQRECTPLPQMLTVLTQNTTLSEAWHVVMNTDPLEDSEDELDENTRLDLCQWFLLTLLYPMVSLVVQCFVYGLSADFAARSRPRNPNFSDVKST